MNSNHQLSMEIADAQLASNREGDNSWVKKLPDILRCFGAVAILGSLYSFLMHGWEGSDDLLRYFMLLGHTGLLAVIGLSSGHFLKEGKSARLLIMLALISVVANFAILGAFIFSEIEAVNPAGYPQYLVWGVDSFFNTVVSGISTFLVLVPVVLISFRVLARGMSNKMSVLFLLSNIALLIPLRDAMLVALLAAALGSYTLFFHIRTTRQRTEAKTREGMFSLLLQFLPVLTLLVRSIWLYQPDVILFVSASLIMFIALRQCTLIMEKASWFRIVSELVSIVLAIFTGLGVHIVLASMGLNDSPAMILATLIAVIMCFEISLRARSGAGLYRIVTSAVLVTGLLVNFDVNPGVIASLSLLMAGSTSQSNYIASSAVEKAPPSPCCQ